MASFWPHKQGSLNDFRSLVPASKEHSLSLPNTRGCKLVIQLNQRPHDEQLWKYFFFFLCERGTRHLSVGSSWNSPFTICSPEALSRPALGPGAPSCLFTCRASTRIGGFRIARSSLIKTLYCGPYRQLIPSELIK